MIPLGRWLLNSRTTGFAASLLLMVNAGQIWMSRSPFSEILAQVLLLGGLWLSGGRDEEIFQRRILFGSAHVRTVFFCED